MDNIKAFGLSSWKEGVTASWNGEESERSVWGGDQEFIKRRQLRGSGIPQSDKGQVQAGEAVRFEIVVLRGQQPKQKRSED